METRQRQANRSVERTRIALGIVLLLVFGTGVAWLVPGDADDRAPQSPSPTVTPIEPRGEIDEPRKDASTVRNAVATVPESLALEPAPATRPVGPFRATVSGRVIDTATRRPVADAELTLLPIAKDLERDPVRARSGTDGTFALDVPVDGPRALRIADGVHATIWLSLPRLHWVPRPLKEDLSLRLGDVPMTIGVTPLVAVVDSSGAPCAGAEVFLVDTGFHTPSGERGPFRFLGVADEMGEWRAEESLPCDGAHTSILAVTRDGMGWAPLALLPLGSVGGMLTVRAWPAREVRFRVLESDGTPFEEAVVELRTQSPPLARLSRNAVFIGARSGWLLADRLSARTDEAGGARLSVPLVSDGSVEWTVQVHARGHELVQLERFDPRQEDVVEVVLAVAPTVDAVTGTVLDSDGLPVPGAVVRLGESTCRVDGSAGTFRLELATPMLRRNARPHVTAAEYRLVSVKVRDEAADSHVVDVVMDRSWTVSGHVIDELGRPLESVRVSAGEEVFRWTAGTRTASDGSFTLSGTWNQPRVHVAAGPCVIDEQWYTDSRTIVQRDARDVRLVLRPDLRPPRAMLRARVLDGVTRLPAPVLGVHFDVPQELMGKGGSPRDVMQDVGTLRAGPLHPGTWHVWVMSSERRFALAPVTIPHDGSDAEVEILVGSLRSIRGRVVATDGSALPDRATMQVAAHSPMGVLAPDFGFWDGLGLASGRHVRSAHDGTFEIPRMAPGDYAVWARGDGLEGRMRVHLPAHEDAVVTLHVKRPAEDAFIALTNLDSRFETPLLLRIEREGRDAEEHETDPRGGRTQTYRVESGQMTIRVYTIPRKNWVPEPGALPIKHDTFVLAAGETRTVALYPR